MAWSDNPVRDFDRHDAEQQDWLERRPKCVFCGEHIQDDYFYIIDGDHYCQNCLDETYKVRTEDYER